MLHVLLHDDGGVIAEIAQVGEGSIYVVALLVFRGRVEHLYSMRSSHSSMINLYRCNSSDSSGAGLIPRVRDRAHSLVAVFQRTLGSKVTWTNLWFNSSTADHSFAPGS